MRKYFLVSNFYSMQSPPSNTCIEFIIGSFHQNSEIINQLLATDLSSNIAQGFEVCDVRIPNCPSVYASTDTCDIVTIMPQKIKSFDVLRTTNEENENGYEVLLIELVSQEFVLLRETNIVCFSP